MGGRPGAHGLMLETVHRCGLAYIVVPELEEDFGITVAFTGRRGGVSSGPFSTLNLSYDVGDERVAVTSNRSRLGEAIGVSPDNWVFCQQVHGAGVMEVGPLERGRGGRDYWSPLPRCDGLFTGLRGAALGVLTADCAPVVLVATPAGAVGIAHAGWRGALAGVTVVALRKLLGYSKCAPGEVLVFIGPHICPECFEVGEEVASMFREKFSCSVSASVPGERSKVDLGAALSAQLESAGVEPNNIVDTGICTKCDEGYFSSRGDEGKTGRQAGMAAIL